MKLIYRYLLKKYNQEYNRDMIRLGQSWVAAVRVHITKYRMSNVNDVRKKEYHYKQAVRYLSYAEDYLDLMK